jgi:PTS system mannose-specific IIC component
MTIPVGKAIAIAFFYWFAKASLTPNLTYAGLKPLPASLIVGLILGDVPTALAAGIVIQLVYIGHMVIGSIVPADDHAAGFLGSALAVCLAPTLGLEAAVASGLSMAVAVATPAAAISNVLRGFNTGFNEKSRAAAERGDIRMQRFWHVVPPQLIVFAFYFPMALIFLLVMGNATVLDTITTVITPISGYLKVVGSVMPAVGIALCLRSIATNATIPYVFVGFILSAYLNMPIFGITVVGVILAILVVFNQKNAGLSGGQNSAAEEIEGEII